MSVCLMEILIFFLSYYAYFVDSNVIYVSTPTLGQNQLRK